MKTNKNYEHSVKIKLSNELKKKSIFFNPGFKGAIII